MVAQFIGIRTTYALRASLCLRARSKAGCIFISRSSLMDNEEYRGKLGKLVGEAKDRRNSEEKSHRGDQAQSPANLLE
jgi:hypothetical protein